MEKSQEISIENASNNITAFNSVFNVALKGTLVECIPDVLFLSPKKIENGKSCINV